MIDLKKIEANIDRLIATETKEELLDWFRKNDEQQEQVKNCSIPYVVGQSEQLVCDYKYHNRDITTNGECTNCLQR
jgi:hypothetical protein